MVLLDRLENVSYDTFDAAYVTKVASVITGADANVLVSIEFE